MPGPIQGANAGTNAGTNAGAFRSADQQRAILESLQNRPQQGSNSYDALHAALRGSFPGVAPEHIHRWTEELLTRVRPPELDLRIAVSLGPQHYVGKNKDFARCVHEMGPAAWEALQNHAAQGNEFGITMVSIGKSVSVDGQVPHGLAKLRNLNALYLDREISDSLMRRLQKAGVRPDVCRRRDPQPKASTGRRQPDDYARLEAEPSRIRTARRDFAMPMMQAATDAQKVTGDLIAAAHAAPSRLDRPLMKRLAAEMARGNRPAVRGIVRAVLATQAPLADARRIDLLMARETLEAAPARAASPRTAHDVTTPRLLLGDVVDDAQRERLDRHALGRRKVFVPDLSAFVEETELLQADEDAHGPLPPPLLHRMCSELPPDSFWQFEAMGAYVEEIVESGLSADARKALCVSAHEAEQGEVSAARWALDKGSPAAAAAILLGVVESGIEAAAIESILDAIDVEPQDVVTALGEDAFADNLWRNLALHRLEAAFRGLDIRLSGNTAKLNDGSQAVVQAHRMWKETGKMVCTAEGEIEELRFHLPLSDFDALAKFGKHVYLVEPDKLTPLSD